MLDTIFSVDIIYIYLVLYRNDGGRRDSRKYRPTGIESATIATLNITLYTIILNILSA